MHAYPKCQSDRVINYGAAAGKPKKQCKQCGYQFTRMTPRGEPLAMKVNAVLCCLSFWSCLALLGACTHLPDVGPFVQSTAEVRSAVITAGTVAVEELKYMPDGADRVLSRLEESPHAKRQKNYLCQEWECECVQSTDQPLIIAAQRDLLQRWLLERLSLRGICCAGGVGLKWRAPSTGSRLYNNPLNLESTSAIDACIIPPIVRTP